MQVLRQAMERKKMQKEESKQSFLPMSTTSLALQGLERKRRKK
jgi:hypothetical protein